MTLGERVRAEREARDWSQAELARRVSVIVRRTVTQVAIHHIESRGDVNPRFVVELAEALGVSLEWLRFGRGPKVPKSSTAALRRGAPKEPALTRTLPVSTIVGAGEDMIQPIEGDDPIDEEQAPPDMTEGEVTEVRGRSMLPVYGDGDRLFHQYVTTDPVHLIGEAVVVRLKDGRRFVKILQTGSRRGRYDLVSINPQFQPMTDQVVDAVAEIVWVKKRPKPRAKR